MTLRLTEFEYEQLIARRKKPERERPYVRRGQRWEDEMAAQLDAAGYGGRYQRQHRFHEDRRFRFDFAFLPEQLAIEVDGAVHRIKRQFRSDRDKGQVAMLRGWRILRVGNDQVRSGEAISLVKRLISTAMAIRPS